MLLRAIDSEEEASHKHYKFSQSLLCFLSRKEIVSAFLLTSAASCSTQSILCCTTISSSSSRMVVPIPILITSAATAVYSPVKDLVRYCKAKRRNIKELEDRLTNLIKQVVLMKSVKENIDTSLNISVSTEKSEIYTLMEVDIAVINKSCVELIEKYKRLTKNHLSSITELDMSTNAGAIIEELTNHKSKIWTLNVFKLPKLSKDVEKLRVRASENLATLMKQEYMVQKKSRPNQDMLDYDDGIVLPVFYTYVDEVWEYLFEEKGKKIGIFGCPGAGKTTVLRRLYDRLLQQKEMQLHNIIRIEYPSESEKLDGREEVVKTLQTEIMAQLGIHLEAAMSRVMNEVTISAFLSERKYILLMDNVSDCIDLNELGLREGHKYKKVVICSRDKKVVSTMTDHHVEIPSLDISDAQRLFKTIYGELYNDEREGTAERIIECCGGIPWVIRSIAMSLKENNDSESWLHVKQILQSECKSNGFVDLGEFDKVYKIKYQGLATNIKKCLLYGALFPPQYKIYPDYLIECWIAEGFLVEKTSQKVRFNRAVGRKVLKDLMDQDLLRWYPGKKHLMMPPHFRRVALEMEYSDQDECVIWVPSTDKHPDQDTWGRVTRMSLVGCRDLVLPQSPECSNMYTLLLQLSKFSDLATSFFSKMKSLQVLDLNSTAIEELPESINSLANLKSLYLNSCQCLAALPQQAADLKHLEFLDIRGTSIPALPQEIKFMVNMRCLRASFSHISNGKQVTDEDFERMIPPGIISSLKNLEELSIDVAFNSQGGVAVAERLATELATLKHLNTLVFNFPNVSTLNTFVNQSKALSNTETMWEGNTFRSFKILIGHCHEARYPHPHESELVEKLLRFSTNEVEEEFSPACQRLLKHASAFEIIGHGGVQTFTGSQFDLRSVKVCVAKGCNQLENIVNGYDTSEEQGFVQGGLLQNLEKIYLYELESLQCIWNGPVLPESFANLIAITISGCPKLTKILDPALARCLKRLDYLKVENCCQVSKIIGDIVEASEIVESSDSDILRSLRKIELLNLPQLESICESTSISWKSLNSLIVIGCMELRNLSLTLTNARKLASVKCEDSWFNALPPDDLKQRLLFFRCSEKEESIEASSSRRSEFIEEEMAYGENIVESKTDGNTNDDTHINEKHQTFGHEILAAT